MSKEQTPIEKFISLKLDTSDITLALELKKFVEQNYLSKEEAQAKILEALEREFNKIDVHQFDEDRYQEYAISGKHYYETEVKPKYE